MTKKIKWAAIQPLTGGFYIGARNAIGCDAEFILSYKGNNDYKTNENGDITTAGNEYSLTCWLKKQNANVPYYIFDRTMFQNDFDMNTNIYNNDVIVKPNYDDLDLVIAVPVCSGLSMVTSAKDETKMLRNCNMLYITQYTLSVIKPKTYVFENAPTLMGSRGIEIREKLEKLAHDNGYCITYYKTDTILHSNCQRRPRTFIIFVKGTTAIDMDFEYNTIDLTTYLSYIPEDATQKINIELSPLNKMLLSYVKNIFGTYWRDLSNKRPLQDIVTKKEYGEFIKFVKNNEELNDVEKTKLIKFITHAEYKKSIGMNFMSTDIYITDNTVPSIQFKNMLSALHPTEDRLFNIRENLHFMGMPHDFELQGNVLKEYNKIGQNVPVKTSEFIISQIINHIKQEKHITDMADNKTIRYIDNIKQEKH